ncbi:PAS domain S-box protein [Halorubrum sp. SS7]|uniref:PAS domain S-box protein n=3 Tax=unclassified Halorubrum TaxID=2642239 RepID=UPI0010F479D2|nr:PAS domain S-box protein [Halorubrum sp. SS7]TKX57251.1 PAS domain S-box protein [Halorubrum sp. SS7]
MEESTVNILHVDDDRAFADLVTEFLEREADDFAVQTATSPNDAFDQFALTEFDCIITDYDMPNKDGIDFLERIREIAPNLPVILFTGKGSEEIASEAISAGVTDYIQKQGGRDQYTVLANRVRNVVDQYHAEAAQERQQKAIETAQVGISLLDETGRFAYANEAYTDIYGYERDQLIGEHWQKLYLDEDVELVRNEILPSVDDGGYWSGETTGLRADGTTFPEDHRLTKTASGELICTVRDLSAEQARQTELIRFRTLMETIEDPVYVLNEAGQFEYVNDAFVRMVGYDRETILGSPPTLVKSADAVDRAEAALGRILSSDGPSSIQFEIEIQSKDGEAIPCEDHMGVLPYRGEEFEGSVGILRDITERKENEKKLEQQNQRLTEFAGVVSHDLQSPLNVAQGRLDLVHEDCDSEHLPPIETALDRIERLTEDMLWLTREGRDIGSKDAIELQETLRTAWQMVADQTEDATLQYADETPAAVAIVADDDRLCQLLENLFSNALMHGGPEVTVTVGVDADGFYIEDDGPGIPEDRRSDVFTAGYSTKDDGIGFGLKIVEQIVSAHGWDIRVAESPTGGARFEITGVEFIRES